MKFSLVAINNSPAIGDYAMGVTSGGVDMRIQMAKLAALISANLDYSVVTSYQSMAVKTTDFSTGLSGASVWAAITGLGSVTVVADGKRRIKVTFQAFETWRTSGGIFQIGIFEGTVGSGTLRALDQSNAVSGITSTHECHLQYVSTTIPAAGTYTFNVGIAGAAGQTGNVSGASLNMFLLGELF